MAATGAVVTVYSHGLGAFTFRDRGPCGGSAVASRSVRVPEGSRLDPAADLLTWPLGRTVRESPAAFVVALAAGRVWGFSLGDGS